MSPQPQRILDLDALLAPIPGDDPAGANLKQLRVHDKIGELRITDDPESSLGALRKGEARVADWRKVIKLATQELSTRGKDLEIASWLTEAAIREHGFPALPDGLHLIKGLLEQYWAGFYPRIEEPEDLDLRAGYLEKFDTLIGRSLLDLELTRSSDGENHCVWEWKQVAKMAETASRGGDSEERQEAVAELEQRREELNVAVKKTPREFYENVYEAVTSSADFCSDFREFVEECFRSDPNYGSMEEPPPTFSNIRDALTEITRLIENLCGGPPVREEVGGAVVAETVSVAGGGTAVTMQVVQAGGGNLPLEPVNRADAIRRLNAIAQFFQKTEPHSPVAYLVQRAARWGEMPLDQWLAEVIGDPTVLDRIRETLGIRENVE